MLHIMEFMPKFSTDVRRRISLCRDSGIMHQTIHDQINGVKECIELKYISTISNKDNDRKPERGVGFHGNHRIQAPKIDAVPTIPHTRGQISD